MTEEAVAIRRELAAVTPDRYRPDLAQSLSNLGARLSQLGRPTEALPVTEERWRSAGNWPPSTRTATAPTSPSR